MRLIALALLLVSVAPAGAAVRAHRRRHAGKAMKQALRPAARPSRSLGAPGDGHQLVVERGTLRLDNLRPSRGPALGLPKALSWSGPTASGAGFLDRRAVLGTELPPPIVLARW